MMRLVVQVSKTHIPLPYGNWHNKCPGVLASSLGSTVRKTLKLLSKAIRERLDFKFKTFTPEFCIATFGVLNWPQNRKRPKEVPKTFRTDDHDVPIPKNFLNNWGIGRHERLEILINVQGAKFTYILQL